ncbi:hypothetical protein CVT26_013270 [Gymnopilus dilepis]|uniref:Uncharacterized protein n=1 Tax=Gymnopilus dilepis TaxID=231916 RepID=A0A409WV62_9AGAR|nr:hypothetical protein CVT26_013270 [Gymnopilus dilepis]
MTSLSKSPSFSSPQAHPSFLIPPPWISRQPGHSSAQQPVFYPLTGGERFLGIQPKEIPLATYETASYPPKYVNPLLSEGKNGRSSNQDRMSQEAPSLPLSSIRRSSYSMASSDEVGSSSKTSEHTVGTRRRNSPKYSKSSVVRAVAHAAPLGECEPGLMTARETSRSPSSTGDSESQLLFPASNPTGSSVMGRLSDEAIEALRDGLGELDGVIAKIIAATGLSLKQILNRWQPPVPRHLNLWNIYQKYFQTNTQKELNRLRGKGRSTKDPSKANMTTIRSAYRAFRKEEPNYKGILDLFWRIHEIDGSNTSLNGRYRDFQKYVNTIRRLAESASNINGFEIAFCAVGSVVQQDQSLSATFCSQKVPNFFLDRLRFSDDELEAHLKAHAYDHESRKAVASREEQRLTASTTGAGHEDRTPFSSATEAPTSASKKRPLLEVLKDRIKKFLGCGPYPCKLSQLQSSRFPFSDFPKILAQHGWIIENWPEDVPFPCDLQKGKGVARLEVSYRERLLKAFDDPQHPIRLVKKFPSGKILSPVPACEPVIIGVAPSSKSEHERGRRRFLDTHGTADRNGPARSIVLSASSKGLLCQNSRKRRACEGHEVCNGKSKRRRQGE